MTLLPIGQTRHVVFPCGHRHKVDVELGARFEACKTSRCRQRVCITFTPATRSDGWAILDMREAT